MKNQKSKYETVDYIFWILFILFTNPGGIFEAFGEDTSKAGSIDMRDFIFALLFGCFVMISIKNNIKNVLYNKVIKYLIIFVSFFF